MERSQPPIMTDEERSGPTPPVHPPSSLPVSLTSDSKWTCHRQCSPHVITQAVYGDKGPSTLLVSLKHDQHLCWRCAGGKWPLCSETESLHGCSLLSLWDYSLTVTLRTIWTLLPTYRGLVRIQQQELLIQSDTTHVNTFMYADKMDYSVEYIPELMTILHNVNKIGHSSLIKKYLYWKKIYLNVKRMWFHQSPIRSHMEWK